MPVQACTVNGKRGFKYGAQGKCYPGRAGHSRAVAQGIAIEMSQRRTHSKNQETYLIGKKNG